MSKMRLIDANALLKECEKRQEQQTYEYCDCFLNDAQEISTEWWCVEDMVMAAPTIDAAPVVRCRDCKEYEQDCGYCDYWEVDRNFDDYCSRGVRKMVGGAD